MKKLETPKEHQVKFFKKYRDNPGHFIEVYNKYLGMLPVMHLITNSIRVIDVGCGPMGGIFSVMKFPSMIGIDPYWRAYSKMYKCEEFVEKVVGTMEDFRYSGKADAIMCLNALQYCSDYEKFLSEIMGHLKDGGMFCAIVGITGGSSRNEKSLTPDDILKIFRELKLVSCSAHDKKVLGGKYPVFSGAWTI